MENQTEKVLKPERFIALNPGLHFRFRRPLLMGKSGMYVLDGPGQGAEQSAFFYYPDGGIKNDKLTDLEVTSSSMIILGVHGEKTICRFAGIKDEQGVVQPMGHQHHLLVIHFHSPFKTALAEKEIEMIAQLQLSYSLSYIDPVTEEEQRLAKWLVR